MAAAFAFDIIGFDLDGTLVDSSLELSASLNHALRSAGRPEIAPARVKSLVGMGAPAMLEMALDQSGGHDRDLVKHLTTVLVDHYEANLGSDCPLFPGLLPALDKLQLYGVTLAVVTNKFEHLAVKLLRNIGLLDQFETVIGGDSLAECKPSPMPIHEMIQRCGGGRAAFVGDASPDIDAARAAQIPSIAVTFGFRPDSARALGADSVIDHYDELDAALARISVGC
ncbi:HAD-IA family hydrolase [Sphingorhabdus arenilitoris]|uniref:phosphoglycolate phosphatase n=1 Tax=Sphingorhabdus arenilitoris TaxID=1490041 RepID=A0ABV8RH23_9SPHN